MLDQLHAPVFAENLHSQFEIEGAPDQWLCFELTEVTERHDVPRQEMFSLIFRGPAEPALPQRMYRFRHPKIGEESMFFVPIAKDESGMQYQVIFNRLKKPAPEKA